MNSWLRNSGGRQIARFGYITLALRRRVALEPRRIRVGAQAGLRYFVQGGLKLHRWIDTFVATQGVGCSAVYALVRTYQFLCFWSYRCSMRASLVLEEDRGIVKLSSAFIMRAAPVNQAMAGWVYNRAPRSAQCSLYRRDPAVPMRDVLAQVFLSAMNRVPATCAV